MYLENDLNKYRLVRLLLSSWIFPALGYLLILISSSLGILTIILSLVGLISASRLVSTLFINKDQITRFGAVCIALLGLVSFFSNLTSTALLVIGSQFNIESPLSKSIKENQKNWFEPSPIESNNLPTKRIIPPAPKLTPKPQSTKSTERQPEGVSVTTKELIRRFITTHISYEEKGQMIKIMQSYSNYVEMNGNEIRKNSVQEDKVEFFRKWPIRTITPVGSFKVQSSGNYEWTCTTRTDFRYESQKRNVSISGEKKTVYTLLQTKNHFSIIGEASSITHTNSTLPAQTTAQNDLIRFVHKCLTDEAKRDISAVIKNYSIDLESYFGKKKSLEEIKVEKALYYSKWPGWSEVIIPESLEIKNRNNRWDVNFTTKFKAWNNTTKATRTGTIINTYTINKNADGKLTIVGQNGKVTLDR